MLRKGSCICTIVLCIMICMLTACQRASTYEVMLLPTNTPKSTPIVNADEMPVPETEEPIPDSAVSAVETEIHETEDIVTKETYEATAAPAPTPELTPTPTTLPLSVPDDDMHYFVKREGKEVRALFSHIYSAILQHQEKINLPENTRKEHVEKVMWLLINDCPELFWFSHISEYTVTDDAPESVLNVRAAYLMSREEAVDATAKIENIVNAWLDDTSGDSDFEKEVYVHDALLNGCRYTNDSGHDGTVYGALIRGKARCQGYANAMCYAMRRLGIECAILTGTATNAQGTENHAWNIMKIDGVWTLSDPTWNDPMGRDVKQYVYFNVTDAMMSRNHALDDVFLQYDLPSCTSMKQNFCVRKGIYLKDGEDIRQGMTEWAVNYLSGDDEPIVICFETSAQYEQAVSLLSECLQTAVDKTGKSPEGGKIAYLTVPDMNYLQFE